ncbi:hypothetical protein [Paraburkholderia sp. DGU8]|uniref:hypothetical protein n=1 Tax=Paraburkholderia sp. DGU8 TaxID=3161997 RepID=UPI0034668328
MEYRIRATGAVVSEAELRAAHPDSVLPSPLTADALEFAGADAVLEAPAPTVTATQTVARNGVTQDAGGNWVTAWVVTDMTADQVAAAQAFSQQQLQASVVQRTQQRLDDFAKTRNYDGILSACTYAASSVAQFAKEGGYAVTARDATWNTLYSILADVTSGKRATPTGYADIEPELPTLAWPA